MASDEKETCPRCGAAESDRDDSGVEFACDFFMPSNATYSRAQDLDSVGCCKYLLARLSAAERENERLRAAMEAVLTGMKNAPELNAINFDEDDALVLNEEMNIACCELEAALTPPREGGGV
jgi:hypothetical protein